MIKFSLEDEARLLELLREEQAIFGQIRELSENQSALLKEDDAELFVIKLDEGQQLIEKINGLHQEEKPLMQSYLSLSGTPGGRKNAGIESAIEALRGEIAACADLNERNMALAKEKTGEYSKKIEKLNASRQTLGKYVQDIPPESGMFDKKT